MSFLDRIKAGISDVTTPKKHAQMGQGISNGGHGMAVYADDMIVPKPVIIFHTTQVFFNFLAMCCFASVAAFQAKWKVGPSGLTGFAIFVSIAGMFLSLFMLLIPVAYEKYDKFSRLARMLKEVRVSFILTALGTTFSALISFIVTISAWTQPGCKDATKDPHAGKDGLGEDFEKGLPGWCNTKKAAGIFFWLAFAGWLASLGFLIYQWRSGKLHTHSHRDPPFTRPTETYDPEDDEESTYNVPIPSRSNSHSNNPSSFQPPAPTSYVHSNASNPDSPFADSNRYSAPGRPSLDAYGAFSDPAPSGFAASASAPRLPDPDFGHGFRTTSPEPQVSRTMQYADPYAAVRASVASAAASSPAPPQSKLPSYESYQGGYR